MQTTLPKEDIAESRVGSELHACSSSIHKPVLNPGTGGTIWAVSGSTKTVCTRNGDLSPTVHHGSGPGPSPHRDSISVQYPVLPLATGPTLWPAVRNESAA
jgi:hypothetical protein